MRIFTAIPLPEEIKDRIGVITRNRLPVPYINTTNLHITLNFFGELTDTEVGKVKKIFLDTIQDIKKFAVQFEKLVKFRDQIHLTVVTSNELITLQMTLQKAFEAVGHKFQSRPYYPHVKLTNLHMDKVMNPERKLEAFPQEEVAALKFTADKVVLFESKLLLHHAHHIQLTEIDLK